jgi:hypothetical protein
MKKLLPLVLLLIGLLGGAAGGWVLRPPAEPRVADGGDTAHAAAPSRDAAPQAAPGTTETLRLPNQFVIPLIENGQVQAMVVIGLTLELNLGHSVSLANDEARLRSLFLQRLFDHANIGGFDGVFTSGETLLALRRTLREAARGLLGPSVHDVLITELLRQES